MTKKIGVVDYDIGNVKSVVSALNKLSAEVVFSDNASELNDCNGIVIPGVGAFNHGMDKLQKKDLIAPISEFASSGKPVLGICLGMQLLFESSNEYGLTDGLALIGGVVKNLNDFNNADDELRLPHVGWCSLSEYENGHAWSDSIYKNSNVSDYFYFVHSYAVEPENEKYILSMTKYNGVNFVSSVKKSNIIGMQFHPEKSGEAGLSLLKKFIELC